MRNFIAFIIALTLCITALLAQNGWYMQTTGTTENLKSIQFNDPNTGWAAGGNNILYTTNGGTIWTSKASGTLTDGINCLHFNTANLCWCTGTTGIIKTTNTGTLWTLQEPGSSGATQGIVFKDNNNGWAVGINGTILNTTNGGTNWYSQNSGTSETLNTVFFKDVSDGWVVGNNGTILKTTDGGANWTSQSSGTYTGDLHGVHFVSITTGWAAGTGGAVFKTTDGGTNWLWQDTKNSDNYLTVFFIDENIGWAGGEFGTIMYTKDGGETWRMQSTTTAYQLNSLKFISNRLGWCAGNHGTIIHSTNGGEEVQANFVADTLIGIAPFNVSFTNQSTGYPSSNSWNFGDGGTSNEFSPTHNYTTSGSFTVTLTITSGTYSVTRTRNNYIVVDDLLTAQFDATPTSGSATLTVNFQDHSLSSIDSWNWNFGDGGSSTFQNPTHKFEFPGDFNVTLAVTNYQGTDSETKTAYIHVIEPLLADFTGVPRQGAAPLEVTFTDLSTGLPATRNWSFGDGGTSTQQNPVHTYQNSGTYTVTLSVTNVNHQDSETKAAYIKVSDDLNAEFTATPLTGELPLNVSFTDMSRGGATNWSWKFGDNTASIEQNPVHSYLLPGTYDVELTISDGQNINKEYKQDYITVTGTPVLDADFSGAPVSGLEPLIVQFSDLTDGGVQSRSWNFGDAGKSTETNPKHTYANDGIYSVTLVVYNGLSYDTAYKENYITVFPKQSNELDADFEADVTSGDKPLFVSFTDKSTGDPTAYDWKFGDGKTSTAKNPTNYYSTSGTFTVSLTVTDKDSKTDTEDKVNYIIVNETIGVKDNTGDNSKIFIEVFPNPFKDFTAIRYKLLESFVIEIKVYDILGNELCSLFSGIQQAGSYNLLWNPVNSAGKLLPEGIYYYRISSNSGNNLQTSTGKMALIK